MRRDDSTGFGCHVVGMRQWPVSAMENNAGRKKGWKRKAKKEKRNKRELIRKGTRKLRVSSCVGACTSLLRISVGEGRRAEKFERTRKDEERRGTEGREENGGCVRLREE